MLSLLAKHSGAIIVWGIIVAALAVGISFLFPRYYSAESQVLVISSDQTGVDPYTQAKAAEQIGDNLAQVMITSDFFDRVMSSTAPFDRSIWQALSERDQRKEWQKDVVPAIVNGTSFLNITTYAPTPDEATNLSAAVTQTLVTQGWEYTGEGVLLKQVDTPLVSRFPTRPNFIMNGIGGFVAGAFLAALWIVRTKRKHFLG